jgi:hypothetical protein
MIDLEERLSRSLSGVAARTITAGDALERTLERASLLRRRRRRAGALVVVVGGVALVVGVVALQNRTRDAIEATISNEFLALRLSSTDGPITNAIWYEPTAGTETDFRTWTITIRGPNGGAISVSANGPLPPGAPNRGEWHTVTGLRSVPVGERDGLQFDWTESGFFVSVRAANTDRVTTTDVIAQLSITPSGVGLVTPPRNWTIAWQGVEPTRSRSYGENTGFFPPGGLGVTSREVTPDWQPHASGLAVEERTLNVRGHEALASRTPDQGWTIQWKETATTAATLTGDKSASIDGLVKIASRLQPASIDNPETLVAAEFVNATTHLTMEAAPGDGHPIMASGTVGTRTWELRVGQETTPSPDTPAGGHYVDLIVDGVVVVEGMGQAPWMYNYRADSVGANAQPGLSGLLEDGTVVDGVLVPVPWGGNPIWVLVAPVGHHITETLTRSPGSLNMDRLQTGDFRLNIDPGSPEWVSPPTTPEQSTPTTPTPTATPSPATTT